MATSSPTVLKTMDSVRTPTVADLFQEYGEILARRIVVNPLPGRATEADVVAIHDRENRLCELVDGVLVEKTLGFFESNLASVLLFLIKTYLETHRIGVCTGADGMIRLGPGLVRIPDVSFLSRDQFPDGRVGREPVPSLSPTLAVEILSKGNTKGEMDQKLVDYFAAGSKLVWYLDPTTRSVRAYTSPENSTLLDESQTLDGGEVLPSFRLSIREWFDRAERPFDAR